MAGGTVQWIDGNKGRYEIRPDFVDEYGSQRWAVYLGSRKIQDDLSKDMARSWAIDHDMGSGRYGSQPMRAAEQRRRRRNPLPNPLKPNHWLLIAVSAAAVVGVIVYAKKAPAATQALPGGGTAPNGLAAGTTTQVNLQPGMTTIAPVVNSQVVLALPSGGTWESVAEGSAAVSLTGTAPWSFYATENVVLTALWSLNGATQTTIINVTPTVSPA